MKKVLMFLGLLGLMGLMGYVGARVAMSSRGNREARPDTLRVTVRDTIPFYQPVAKDSLVVRYVTRVLAVASSPLSAGAMDERDSLSVVDGSGENAAGVHGSGDNGRKDSVAVDSVAVEVPISQKKYETEAYRAYVSGYEPSLDSIFLYEKTVRETIIPPLTRGEWWLDPPLMRRARWQERFGFGVAVGGGYGIIHKEADIFIGGSVTFRIWP